MREDTVITIKDGKSYLLLLESEETDESYFLSVLLDDNGEPTNTYAILEEVSQDNKTFVKKISDPLLLNRLLVDYRAQYDDLYEGENAA